MHLLKRGNYVANGLSGVLQVEFTPTVYKIDRRSTCVSNCSKALRENDHINISLFYESNVTTSNTPFVMVTDNNMLNNCLMWETISHRNISVAKAIVISTNVLSLTINDTINPNTRVSIRCESNTYLGRNPLYTSNIYGTVATSQDTVQSNRLVYKVEENKVTFDSVVRHILCTTLNPGNLTFSFQIASPIDYGDNITFNSNNLDEIFLDSDSSSANITQISCILNMADDKLPIPISVEEKSSTKLIFKVLKHVPSDTGLLLQCYNDKTFKVNGKIGSTLEFNIMTTQDYRASVSRNYTIIPNQVVFKHYKSSNSYYTNSPPPAGLVLLKFRILLGLVDGDSINIVSNENIFLSDDKGYVQTKCGLSSKANDYVGGNSAYAFNVMTTNKNRLQLEVRSEQVDVAKSAFEKDTDVEIVCFNSQLYINPFPDKMMPIFFNISTSRNDHPISVNVFSIILNQPQIYSVERTGSYFTRQDPKDLIIKFELKTDLTQNGYIEIYSTGDNHLFNVGNSNDLSYTLSCEGVSGTIGIKGHEIVSQNYLKLQAGEKINRDKLCNLYIGGNDLYDKNRDVGFVDISLNTTADFIPGTYKYPIRRSTVVNATVQRLGSKIVYQNGGDLQISFVIQNNISEFDFVNITSSQSIFKVDDAITTKSSSSNDYKDMPCSVVSNELSKNGTKIALNYSRIYLQASNVLVIKFSCENPQINYYNRSISIVNASENVSSTMMYRGQDTCNNAKVLIPKLTSVKVTCKSAALYNNPSRATLVNFNIVTTNDFQSTLSPLPGYNINYEPYKVILHSIGREGGTKYAGYDNGDLVVRLSPLSKLVGGGSDKILIESKVYNLFLPPNLTAAASNSSDVIDSYNSCQLQNEVPANKNTINNSVTVSDIVNRAIFDSNGKLLTIVLLGTNETVQIDSLTNLVLTCNRKRIKNHLCPADVEFDVKTNRDYEIATAYEGNNMYKIQADSECVKLRCGLVKDNDDV